MKLPRTFSTRRNSALTLIEILVIVAVLAVLVALLIPRMWREQALACRIQCNNDQKFIGLTFREWSGDNHDRYPMAVSQTNGGTMEFVTGPNAFRHFQVMSNELSTAKCLICPADSGRIMAHAWDTNMDFYGNGVFLSNSNLSYFVGVDASKTNPQLILTGDRNITNGMPVKNGLFALTTNNPAGWTHDLHNNCGNIAVADGHVEQANTSALQSVIADTGLATNRLLMPILGP